MKEKIIEGQINSSIKDKIANYGWIISTLAAVGIIFFQKYQNKVQQKSLIEYKRKLKEFKLQQKRERRQQIKKQQNQKTVPLSDQNEENTASTKHTQIESPVQQQYYNSDNKEYKKKATQQISKIAQKMNYKVYMDELQYNCEQDDDFLYENSYQNDSEKIGSIYGSKQAFSDLQQSSKYKMSSKSYQKLENLQNSKRYFVSDTDENYDHFNKQDYFSQNNNISKKQQNFLDKQNKENIKSRQGRNSIDLAQGQGSDRLFFRMYKQIYNDSFEQ